MRFFLKIRRIRRLCRHWIYILAGILAVQVFFIFYSTPSLVEEENIALQRPRSIDRQNILAESLLQNKNSILERKLNDSDPIADESKYRDHFIRNSKSDNYVFQDYGNRKRINSFKYLFYQAVCIVGFVVLDIGRRYGFLHTWKPTLQIRNELIVVHFMTKAEAIRKQCRKHENACGWPSLIERLCMKLFQIRNAQLTMKVPDSHNPVNKFSKHEPKVLDDGDVKEKLHQPSCKIVQKDALSAISRAKTEQCKQEIADASCSAQNGTLLPDTLPRFCSYSYKFAGQAPIPNEYNGESVKICFMLVVHGRGVRQFKRLFKVLYHTDHYFYIHVDIRSDHLHREILKFSKNYKNVVVAPWRMATIWGGSSLLQMLLRAIDDVLRLWKDWDFFINLSGMDFPIETNDNLVKFLSAYKDRNFMKSHGRDDEKFIRKQGLNKIFVECDQHMWRIGDRNLIDGVTLNGGSDWVTLNRNFCNYVINGNDRLLEGLKHWYRYTLLPAESFFHTLAQNSNKCASYVDNNMRVTNWNRARGCKCQYKHIVDWCGCSPNDFYPRDLPRLQTSRPVFFARKFEESINQEVVNHLDFKLYGKYKEASDSVNSYWENVYDTADSHPPGDAFLTHYHAFARIGLSKINPTENAADDECRMIVTKLTAVEMYRHQEEFKGYVVTFDARWYAGQYASSVPMQALVSHQQRLTILDSQSPLSIRLQSAAVGTNWDVKELVLRDWGGIVGPTSSPRLIARWGSSKDDFMVTVAIIDPLNVVADYSDFKTPPKNAGVTDTPINLNKPLRPGVWKVWFYIQRQFQSPVAELKFVVAPLQYRNGQTGDISIVTDNRGVISDDDVNSGKKNMYSIRTSLNLNRDDGAEESLEERATYVGEDLEAWVDEVLKETWTSDGLCIAHSDSRMWSYPHSKRASCPNFIRQPPLCKTLPWSSLSPDPKSELGRVKPDGRIR